MAKITAIKQQIKRPDRYSIYIDGKYVCPLSEGELLKHGLRINQEMSGDELEKLKADSVMDKARDRALNQLSRRPRSEWELRDYLKRKEYSPEVIDETITHLRDRGYVDDLDFARRWVESRRLLKSTSKRRLAQELKQKRVSDEIARQVLEEDETDELAVLRSLIERKQKQTRYQDEQKLIQYLARQGFSYGAIKNVLEEEKE